VPELLDACRRTDAAADRAGWSGWDDSW